MPHPLVTLLDVQTAVYAVITFLQKKGGWGEQKQLHNVYRLQCHDIVYRMPAQSTIIIIVM